MKTTVALLLAMIMLTLVGCQPTEVASESQKPLAENHASVSAGEEKNPDKTPAADTPNTNTENTQEISREDAEKIALDHAGLTADAVTRLHTEYDRDRINHYEVEFHYERYEYSYEIHAETGEILDFEKEVDD